MAARNGADSYGWISRLIHWLMALGILAMLGLGTYIHTVKPTLATLWLFGLHKTVGICLLALVLLRLVWHRISPPPPSLAKGIPAWQLRASHAVHLTIYALMLAVPVTGWIGSAATGIDVVIFNSVTLPRIAPVSEAWEHGFFLAHWLLTRALIAALVLHIAGALQRHYHRRDRTLVRMIRG